MTLPSLALSLVCALLIGALFHLAVDGGGARLVLYLALSILGFTIGQLLAVAQGWSWLAVGPLQLGFAALGSLAVLLLGHWLSLFRVETGTHDDTV
jgi:hypothetical protein